MGEYELTAVLKDRETRLAFSMEQDVVTRITVVLDEETGEPVLKEEE